MRTFSTLIFAATAVLTNAAFAAPANVPAAQSSVQIKGAAVRGVQMNEAQFSNFTGEYQLSNGKRLTVINSNTRYFAQIDGKREVEIVPTGANSFVSTNSGIALTFGVQSNGVADAVVVAARN